MTTLETETSSSPHPEAPDQLGTRSLDYLVFKDIIIKLIPKTSSTSDTDLDNLLSSRLVDPSRKTLDTIAEIKKKYSAGGNEQIRTKIDDQQRDYAALFLFKAYAHYAVGHEYLRSTENRLGYRHRKLNTAKEHFQAALTSLQESEKRGTQGIQMLKALAMHQVERYDDMVAVLKDTLFGEPLEVLKHALLANGYDKLQDAGKRDEHAQQARTLMAPYDTTFNTVIKYARSIVHKLPK